MTSLLHPFIVRCSSDQNETAVTETVFAREARLMAYSPFPDLWLAREFSKSAGSLLCWILFRITESLAFSLQARKYKKLCSRNEFLICF